MPTVGVPQIGVYMAKTSKPTDSVLNFDTDITTFVRKIGYRRGRNNPLNEINPGSGDATIDDALRRFDPSNAASPYYPNIVPMRPIQMKAEISGHAYYLATQFVERWPRKRVGRSYAERGITTIDGFDLLSLAGLAGKTYGTQLSGSMIAAILNDANWSASLRSLSSGKASIAAQTFTTTDTTKALGLIQQIVGPGGENGIFYINGRGVAVFLDRQAQITAPFSTSQATFTDLVTMAGEFGVTDIQPTSDKDLIVNDWTGTRAGGAAQQAIASASFLQYGRRSKQVSSLLTTDADTLNSMVYSVSIYKDPLQRIEKITIKPGEYAELWVQCLSREIGDRVTIKEHPPGGGQADINDYVIQGIDAKFDIGPVSSAVYTWSLFPAPALSFILDNLTLGRLDNNRLGY